MTLLYKELKKQHQVRFLAFKRQYPAGLYPGDTDRDTSRTPIMDSQIEPALDSLNPLTWFQVFLKIKAFSPDLVIFPWWVSFWTVQFWTISFLIKRFLKIKVLFVCHNVVEHEANAISKLCTKFVLKNGDYFIVHSEAERRNLKDIIPRAKITKAFHPTYEVFKQNGWDKKKAQAALDISGNVILFFGFIRPYKGLVHLLEALPNVLKRVELTLLIAGEFWGDENRYLAQIERLGIKDRVKIIDRYIPNEEINLYFAASDVVVVPYSAATGSGIVQVAFGCERPVITTKVGSLGEVVQDGRTGYLVEPNNAKSLAQAIVNFYIFGKEDEFAHNIKTAKREFSWAKMRQQIEALEVINV